MDTRSTNSKRFSFLIAGLLVVVASAVFLMMYPFFQEKAAEHEVDALSSDSFLTELYQGSCVLYKDITETVMGEATDYADLYLTIREEKMESDGYGSLTSQDIDYASVEAWKQDSRERINNILASWQSETMSGLAQEMDYCVIDERTGRSIKNTGRELEKLGTDEASGEIGTVYPYYVRISYDRAGNLSSVSVKGENSDELLKSVQRVMKSNTLWTQFWSNNHYYEFDSSGGLYYYDEENAVRKLQLMVDSTPKDTTYVFALTQEQKEKILKGTDSSLLIENTRWSNLHAYYMAGTGDYLRLLLILLAAIIMILPRSKRYCLHALRGVKVHLEFSLTAVFLMLSIGGEAAIYLVNNTNRGYFNIGYARYAAWIPEAAYPFLTFLLNIATLVLIFGIWYYLVLTLSEMSVIGIREFFKERSLIRKCWIKLTDLVKRNIHGFKEEILHVDLGEKANKLIMKLVAINFLILATACVMWVFGWAALIIYSIVLYFVLKKYVQRIQGQYRKLLDATRSIAEGNLQTEFEEDWGVFESYKKELAKIQNGFKKAVEEEVKSQRMKGELITNVSHDLKTPLTAIITYIELLQEENVTQQQQKEYLEVLKRKSTRLKSLIDDLFEVSKASSGNITFDPVDVDICNLLRQVYLEHEDKVEKADLIFRFQMPEEKIILKLDSQKTYRVFENLYVNIIKYAMPHTRVYVSIYQAEKGIRIELKNVSGAELNIAPEELTERFVRGDSSRNTEGSGLGLAIARSFVELQGGKLDVEIDGDLFKVIIYFSS